MQEVKLLSKQTAFLDSPVKELCYAGAIRSGKTWAACIKAIHMCEHYPKIRGLIGRLHYPALRDSTQEVFFDIYPETRGSFNKAENIFTFRNGSKVFFRHLEDLDKSREIQGMTLGFVFVDQAEEITEQTYLMLMGRISQADTPRQIFITCNPEGHNWIWKRFKLPGGTPERLLIETKITDNPHLPADYISALQVSYPQDMADRLLYGSWEVRGGQLVYEFDPMIHTEKPLADLPFKSTSYLWADVHERTPSAFIWAYVLPDGSIHCYDYLWQGGSTIEELVNIIRAKEGKWRKDIFERIIDPACCGTAEGKINEFSIQEAFQKYGLYFEPGDNDFKAGYFRLAGLLRQTKQAREVKPGQSPLTPGILFWKTLTEPIYQFCQHSWKDQILDREPIEKPEQKNKHFPDAVRYGVMAGPRYVKYAEPIHHRLMKGERGTSGYGGL